MDNNLTVTERLAQLLIESKSGLKSNLPPINIAHITKPKKINPQPIKVRDIIEIQANNSDTQVATQTIKNEEIENFEELRENPLIHNIVVDKIAKKILKLYIYD